jgi:thioredoxin-like negative regulator of GroEL
MLERLLLALLIAAAAVLAWRLYQRYSLRRLTTRTPADPALADVAPGTPVIVYFTTPFCAPCRTQQRPALDQIAAHFGMSVQIVQVDAAADTETADRWGVLSAPTTFVLDAAHQPRYVNRGVADEATLREQLAAIA